MNGIDPKASAGEKRPPLAVLPWAVVYELSLALGEGATKYGRHNWRHSGGVVASTYYAAAMRHLIAFYEGEDIDPDSGLPHLTKAIASLSVLRDAQICNVCADDRPPASPPEHLAAIKALWPDVQSKAMEFVERENG